MSTRRFEFSLIAAGVIALAGAADSGSWKPMLPEAEFTKLVAAETKIINDTLAQGIADKKLATKAKASAVMVAAYSQSAMTSDPAKTGALAGLRDRALKLAKAAADGNVAEAKSLAAGLTANGEPSTNTGPVDLAKHLDLDDLMQQFKPERGGGKELEKKLKAYSGKRAALSADDVRDAVNLAYQCAVIARFTEDYAPERDEGNKKKADWIKLSQEMARLSLDAAKVASATKPDDKAVKAALKKLDDNCTKCHSTFRD